MFCPTLPNPSTPHLHLKMAISLQWASAPGMLSQFTSSKCRLWEKKCCFFVDKTDPKWWKTNVYRMFDGVFK